MYIWDGFWKRKWLPKRKPLVGSTATQYWGSKLWLLKGESSRTAHNAEAGEAYGSFRHWWEAKNMPDHCMNICLCDPRHQHIWKRLEDYGRAWESLLYDINSSKSSYKKTRGQEMKAVTSGHTVIMSGFSDPTLYLFHQHSHSSPLGDNPTKWVLLPLSLPFTEVALLGNSPQAVLCSCGLWTPSRMQNPRGQESKGKSNHLHVLLCLINFKWIFQCFRCSWTALQHPAISLNGCAPCRKMEWGWLWCERWRRISKTITWTLRSPQFQCLV